MANQPVINLLLDSGAFSAYTQKQPVDIAKYADFAARNQQHVRAVVNLDVINPSSAEEAAQSSLNNFHYLKDRGLYCMPVFHAAESIKWLDTMLEQTDYIGISASMTDSSREAGKWYDIVFSHVCDQYGFPLAKFHAFGDTVVSSLTSYPWYSADSTTWVIAAGMAGRIFLKDKSIAFRTRTARDRFQITKEDSGLKRETWEAEFRRAGLNPDPCINDENMRESDIMLLRTYVNAFYFMEISASTASIDRFKRPTMLGYSMPTRSSKNTGIMMNRPFNMHFVFTSSTAYRALAVLTALGAPNMLISYFYIVEKQWNELIVPYLYDPIGIAFSNQKVKEQIEILNKYLLKPLEKDSAQSCLSMNLNASVRS